MPSQIAKLLIFAGLILVAVGLIFLLASKIQWIGRLPGDIYIQKKNFSFYFPVTTCIIISIIVSIIVFILRHK